MNLSSKGINPQTKQHIKNPLTHEESKFLDVLWIDHNGENHKISAQGLARAWAMRMAGIRADTNLSAWMRDVRDMQNHLLFEHNIPILSKAGDDGGYWIAENEREAAEFYGTFRKRGLTGLVKASRGKQSAMVDMVTQLSFEFDEILDKTDEASQVPVQRTATPIEVVDAFFKKMMENPEQYADGLRKIGQKYGNVLLPRKRYEEIVGSVRAKAAELQALAASLEN